VNAIVQSVRFSVYTYALGVTWVIVTLYVPALLVSSYMIVVVLIRPAGSIMRVGDAAPQRPDESRR
jgi:hypothetical protein